jgi:hypothetical protein
MAKSTPKKPPDRLPRTVAESAPRLPERRMTVIAQDPSVRRNKKTILMATVAIPAEDLIRGPMGYRVHVVDYDSTSQQYHGPHVLPDSYENEPAEWKDGDPRIVDDFRFHAQNVYALVMKTLARFEFALGRRIGWSFHNHQLKVAPHGMFDANAFYSPVEEGLVFGYFEGSSKPKAPIFTALSHDIIVHETTHALLDALRERYLVPSNPDQAAFHEGFADVIALLSVFSQPEVVKHLLQPPGKDRGATLIGREQCQAKILRQSSLFGLAEQMGQELEGLRGGALRKSVEIEADPHILDQPDFLEPHRRGEVFVAAVMNSFIDAWSDRILRSGVPGQKKFPLARVAEEGADIADAFATLWIRALDYMPPVHLTFDDALTAALTSDTQVRPDDSRFRLRHYMKEQFAAYGIAPVSQDALQPDCWKRAPEELRYDRVRFESMRSDKDEVFRFLWENRKELELETDAYARVLSVRPCQRTGIDGFVLRETVAEYYQVARLTPKELELKKIKAPPEFLAHIESLKAERVAKAVARKARNAMAGPLRSGNGADASPDVDEADDGDDDELVTALYGGGVLIFDEYGRLKYHIHNNVFGTRQEERLRYLWESGLLSVKAENAGYRAARLSTLHRLRAIDARKWPAEGW